MDTKVGFIGLGFMGIKMARNILKKGFPLVCYDVRKEAMSILAKEGAEAATSPAEVARKTDIIITMLPATKEVEQVALGPGGIIEGIRPGSVFINMRANCKTQNSLVVDAAQTTVITSNRNVNRKLTICDNRILTTLSNV